MVESGTSVIVCLTDKIDTADSTTMTLFPKEIVSSLQNLEEVDDHVFR
jgi:hypothetical protein